MKKVIVIEWMESGISKGFAPVLVEKTKRHQMFLDDKNEPKIFKSRKEAKAFVEKWLSTFEEIFNAKNPITMKDKIEDLRNQVEKLQAFKDYVHKRLDDAGIEKEPNGEHSQHGCRIGDRLDIVLSGGK